MRLLCWNTNGIAATARAALNTFPSGGLAAFFASLRLDLACLQECKLSQPKLTEALALPQAYDSAWAFSAARQGYSGVVTFTLLPSWAPVAPPLPDALPDVDPAAFAATARVPAVTGDEALRAARDPAGPEGPGVGAGGGAPAALPPTADPARPRPAYAYEGRALETDHGAFVLLNLYAPNAGDRARDGGGRAALKAAFLTAVRARVDQHLAAGREVIVVGDLNVAATPDDVATTIAWDGLWSRAEADALAALMAAPLVDVWRATHPDVRAATAPPKARGFTVWDERTGARSRDAGLRIDFVLVSSGLLAGGGATCEVAGLDPGWSDHDGLILELPGVGPPPRPAGSSSKPQPGMEGANPQWKKGASVKALFSRAAAKKAAEGSGRGGGKRGVDEGGATTTPPPPAKKAAPPPPPPPKPSPPKGSIASFFKPKQK